jgi:hypothetical protein
MLSRKLQTLLIVGFALLGNSCGSDPRLLSIQIYPADPNLAHNTTFYLAPFTTIQFQIQGWYSNRLVQTLPATSGKWASNNTPIVTVDANGLTTAVGPAGVASIFVTVRGHSSSVVVAVCDPTLVVCPPPP